jgi:hypothetical protein
LKQILVPPPFPRRQYFVVSGNFGGGAGQMGGAQIFYFTRQPKATWHGPDIMIIDKEII